MTRLNPVKLLIAVVMAAVAVAITGVTPAGATSAPARFTVSTTAARSASTAAPIPLQCVGTISNPFRVGGSVVVSVQMNCDVQVQLIDIAVGLYDSNRNLVAGSAARYIRGPFTSGSFLSTPVTCLSGSYFGYSQAFVTFPSGNVVFGSGSGNLAAVNCLA